MKKTLEKAAKHGRHGDNRLLHVSQEELDGLASLIPGGKLPKNPDTGLPEAFFFLPFLAGLAGAAAAPAAAATGLAATTAAAAPIAAAALPAATTAATAGGLTAAGLTSAAAPITAGMTAASALPTATAVLPAATAATAAPVVQGGLTGLQASGLSSGVTTAMNAASPALSSLPGTMVASNSPGIMGLGATSPAAASLPTATSLLGTGTAGSGAASGLGGLPTLGGVPMAAPTASTAALPSATMTTGAALPTGPMTTIAAPTTGATHLGASPLGAATAADGAGAAGVGGLTPVASTTAGATKTGLAGLFGGMDTSKLLQYGALGAMMMPRGGGGGSKEEKSKSQKEIGGKQYDAGEASSPSDGGSSGGVTPEWKYFPNAKYYAEGGPVSGGVASLMDKGSQPVSQDDEQLIDATVAAIQGQTPDAQPVIQAFIQTFGEQALQDLVQQITGKQSASDGMNDAIPAQIGGGVAGLSQPAQLSEGEFVVPSDVVSHLGNGSTQAGGRALDDMVKRTRQARGAKAPTQIDPNQVLPV